MNSKELNAGAKVTIRARSGNQSEAQVSKGLTYPAFSGELLDDAGVSQGWDVVDVKKEDGEVVSVYCFSIER